LLSYLPGNLTPVFKEKRLLSTLGYDPYQFYFNEKERQVTRGELSVDPDEVVFITSTRVTPEKELESIIHNISTIHSMGHKVRYIIIGFLNDAYGRSLRTSIARQPKPSIFHCYPFSDPEKIRRFYCGSDIGIWKKAAISIQQAMGTGLPVLLEYKPNVNHLVKEGETGWYFEPGELSQTLLNSVSKISKMSLHDRIECRNYNEEINRDKFSYTKIASTIINESCSQ
jgi:glycosyltransferase involved in cell wall biosynthesis